jgi:hypothetical protein
MPRMASELVSRFGNGYIKPLICYEQMEQVWKL